jgi:hypothetical protein
MQPVSPLARNAALYVGLILVLFVVAVAYVMSFKIGWRAILIMHGGTVFLLGCGLFMKELRRFLLFVVIFVFPLEFGYHFVFVPPPLGTDIEEVWSFANGIRLDSADFILFVLYLQWAARLATDRLSTERVTLGSPLGAVLLVWIGYVLIAAMVKAEYRIQAIFEVFVLLKGFFLFLYLVNNVTTLRDFRVVYYALVGINVFLALFMVFQWVTGLNYDMHGEFSRHTVESEGFRPAGFIGCADCASSLIDIALPLVLAHFMIEKDGMKRAGLAAAIVMLVVGLMVTKVRAALMAVIILGVTVLWISQRRKWITWRKTGAVILMGFALLLLTSPLMIQRFRTGAYGEDRLPLVYTALNMIKANPLLGVGVNNYQYRISDYKPREYADSWVYIVHNELLLRLAEQGIIGATLYYVVTIMMAVRLFRLTRSTDPWIFIGSCGLFAACLGSVPHRLLTSYYFQSMFYMICIMVALTCVLQRLQEKRTAPTPEARPQI